MPEPVADQTKPTKPSILVQLDTDPQPSVFDGVVAVDAGVHHLFRHGVARPETVRDLVYGLLFTRGVDDLRRSAVFIGGSDVDAGEAVLAAVLASFFGPFRVSVALDSKGANTTAAAAVLAIERSLGNPLNASPQPIHATVIGAGPVGRRVARLLARRGAQIRIATPDPDQVVEGVEMVRVKAGWEATLAESEVLVAAGPPGVEVLPGVGHDQFPNLKVAVDLNAVPPHGLGETKPTDADKDRDGVRTWGALGVGALKMKIHKALIRAMFSAEPTVFDLDQVFEVASRLDG